MSWAGQLAGALLAPFTYAASWLRQSRMFHPRGILCSASVELCADAGGAVELGRALEGDALIRWSSALWKRAEWQDVLGCAIRFTRAPFGATAQQGDQDLLFATIRRPWTMALSPFTTEVRDFLQNRYYAVSPFRASGLAPVEWRLSPEQKASSGRTRAERLERAVGEGASLLLEWCPYRKPWQAFDERRFRPLVRLRLTGFVDLDQESLRFDPFRSGRGIAPVGFVHALRRATYAASQRARPESAD